jgi:hypothetical protein
MMEANMVDVLCIHEWKYNSETLEIVLRRRGGMWESNGEMQRVNLINIYWDG